MPYWVEIEVANPTESSHTFTIPKGRMITPKNLNDKVQNLVVIEDTITTVPPKGKVIVTVPTECTDPSYRPPNNTVMDVSTFGQRERTGNVFPGGRM